MSEKVNAVAELELEGERDSRETIVVAGSVASAVLGAIYWISRIGFANPATPVLDAVGLAMFVLAAPLWLMRLSVKRRIGVGEWWSSQSAFMLACILSMATMGLIAQVTGVALAPVLALPGAGLALWTMFTWLRRGRILATLVFLPGTVAFTVWTAGVVWGSRYKMPLYWETFALNANVHHDPIYYASMANMFETYGRVSTGIDGLSVARYHFGSAWLFEKWAHLIGTDVLSFYSLGYPIIVIPVFFAAILLLAIEIRRVLAADSERPLRADWRLWLVLLVATVGIIPTDALDGLAIWNANVLISESYLIAVPVFLLVVGCGIAFWRSDSWRAIVPLASGSDIQPTMQQQRSAWLFLVGLPPLSIFVAGLLKLSLMLLLLTTIVYIAIRLRLWNSWPARAGLAASLIAAALTYPVVAVSAQNGGVAPLNFMRYEVADGWQQFFPLMGLLWTWVYIAGRLWEDRITTTRALRLALGAGKLVDAEVVLVIAVVGFLPGELLSIHGGSAFYFSDVQRWVALAFIFARLGFWVRKWRAISDARGVRIPGGGWRGIRLATVLLVFVAAPFALTIAFNAMQWPIRMLRANVALRMELATKGGGGIITDPLPLGRGLRKTTYFPVVTALRDISRLPLAERRQSGLFIPQSYREFWGMFDSDQRCTYVSLVAPALAGVVLIDGMPAADCRVTHQYNMAGYTPRSRPQLPSDITPAALCSRARASGLSRMLVLSPDASGLPKRSRIACTS